MTETKIYRAILSLVICDSGLHFLFHSLSVFIKYDDDRLHSVWPSEKYVWENILRVMMGLSCLLCASLEVKFCLFGRVGVGVGSSDSKCVQCDFKNTKESNLSSSLFRHMKFIISFISCFNRGVTSVCCMSGTFFSMKELWVVIFSFLLFDGFVFPKKPIG